MEELRRQGPRFIVVGLAATLVHFAVAIALVETDQLAPFWANIPTFFTAFLVSYVGHLKWTFGVAGHHQQRLPRFLSIAMLAFGLNQLIIHLAVDRIGLDYRLGLAIVVLTVPPIVFFAGRAFAFAEIEQASAGRRRFE